MLLLLVLIISAGWIRVNLPLVNMASASGSGAIAVLIDAENVAPEQAEQVLHWFRSWKGLLLKRAYGNWFKLQHWESWLIKHDVEPIHALPVSQGKNAADMRLTVDAVDLLYKSRIRQFCIISSDGDFAPLARYLRQQGAKVLGVGQQKASIALKAACYQFVSFEQLKPAIAVAGFATLPVEAESVAAPVADKPYAKELHALSQQWYQALAPLGDWVSMEQFHSHLLSACKKKLRKPFSCKLFGYEKMADLIEGIGLFEWNPGQPAKAGHSRQFRRKRQ